MTGEDGPDRKGWSPGFPRSLLSEPGPGEGGAHRRRTEVWGKGHKLGHAAPLPHGEGRGQANHAQRLKALTLHRKRTLGDSSILVPKQSKDE